MNWTTPHDIRAQVQRLWDDQSLLADVAADIASEIIPAHSLNPGMLEPRVSFPLTLRFRKPSPGDLASSYDRVKDWVRALEAGARTGGGRGYDILWTETNHRVVGRNVSPTAVLVPTRADALAIIDRDDTASAFASLVRLTLSLFPELVGWCRSKPLRVVEEAAHWANVLAVIDWFRVHPRSGHYLRQIDVAEVDTKFIERRKALIAELLDILLPAEAIDTVHSGLSGFEARYGLASKPVQIRFRILDDALSVAGLTDLTVRADEFARLALEVDRVFVVENEINGLAFPHVKRGLVVFRLGYAVDLLASARWLGDCQLHYWGDIDTHGFAMLDRFRAAFPNAKSFLMDRDTLIGNQDQWTHEATRHVASLHRLTPAEAALFDDLRFDRLARGVRLEQERIPFGQVIGAIDLAIA
jgi:hypothetical protein